MRNFSTRIKIIAVLIMTFIIFLFVYFIYQNTSQKKNEYLSLLQKNTVNSIILLKTDFLEKLSIDYACYDWMVHFIESPDIREAKENITPVNTLGLSFIQIYNLKFQNLYTDYLSSIKDQITIPGELFSILSKKRHLNFFLPTKYGLVQIVASTIHYSDDLQRKKTPKGFFIIGKIWDANYLHNLERLTGNKYFIMTYMNNPLLKSKDISYISLPSLRKDLSYYLIILKNNPYISLSKELNSFYDKFLILAILLILIVTILAYNILVLKPLGHIIYTLDTVSPEKLIKTALRGDEFGKISRFLLEFFSQRNTLQLKLTELSHTQNDLYALNEELHAQKEELLASSEKLLRVNEEITESIKYASIIQYSVLNAPASFFDAFPNHFIYYKPRNIVSGDFYWIQENNGNFYIACADCTGHSIAGALLSMLGISFLKDIVNQQNGLSAAEIMNSLREYIVETLKQTGEFGEAHSGMDIVLLLLDPVNSKIEYASAFNSFYIVAQNSDPGKQKITEYKGDNMPVGIYLKSDSFTNHMITIEKGDMIYLFSDGYIDQFGGPNNKKFRTNNFKELILSISGMNCKEQKRILEETYEKWRGENQQTDDILIMGIRYEPIIYQ